MKKILFAAMIAILIVGCQKTEVINQQGGPSLSFSTGMSKLTKSQGTVSAVNPGIRNLEAQDFSVWAYAGKGDFSSVTNLDSQTKIYDGIENLLVECKNPSVIAVEDDPNTTDTNEKVDGVPGTWSTKKEYYWPGDQKSLRFFAVSADQSWLRTTPCPVAITYNVPSLTISNFEVKATAVKNDEGEVIKKAANEDLMVADFVEQDQTKKNVDLTFRHTLSKVQFDFKTLTPDDGKPAPYVWVQSVSVAGMQYKGNLNVTVDPEVTERTAWKFEWDQDEATETFTDDYNEQATYLEGSEAAVLADDTAMKLTTKYETFTTWLMLPQDIDENSKVTITYVINKRQFTSIFPLNGDKNTTISAWTCNQHIKYNVILAPNVISFKPIVQDWTNPSTDIPHEN